MHQSRVGEKEIGRAMPILQEGISLHATVFEECHSSCMLVGMCFRVKAKFSFPILQNLSNGVTVKTEENRHSPNEQEEDEEVECKEEGKSSRDEAWERHDGDIDPSRYVIVVENQKKSRERLERIKLRKSTEETETKRQKRRDGSKKKSRRNFTCDICREELTNEEELEGHRRSRHINEKSEFFCDFCLKIFKTKAILKGHRYKHVTDPQYLCVRCGKKYFTISNLNEHSLYCLDEKKFECPVCYKKFNVNKQFKRHLVIHEADRYIKCTVCEQTFSRKDNYRQHFRRHTGEKPYTCDICGKSFRIKATYNYHRRTHRDVRPTDAEAAKTEEYQTFRKESDAFFAADSFPVRREYPFGRDTPGDGSFDAKTGKEMPQHRLGLDYPAEYAGNFLRKGDF